MARSRRGDVRRELRGLVLRAVLALVFFVLMVNVVLPWAVDGMVAGFLPIMRGDQP